MAMHTSALWQKERFDGGMKARLARVKRCLEGVLRNGQVRGTASGGRIAIGTQGWSGLEVRWTGGYERERAKRDALRLAKASMTWALWQ